MSDRVSALERHDARLVVLPSFDPVEGRIELTMAPGATIADAVALALPGLAPELQVRLRVTIGAHVVPAELWGRVRPKLWDTVLIRVVPGSSTDILRAGLMIAITVAAVATGQLYGAALASSVMSAALGATVTASAGTAAIASALITATVAIGGTALVNALVPVRQVEQQQAEARQAFAIDGFQNQATPDGPVPQLFGEMRFSLPYACWPHGEVIEGQRYIRAAFLASEGPLDLSAYAPRLGMTDLAAFQGVEVDAREGYASDEPLTLTTQQVLEEPLSIALPWPAIIYGYSVRTTARDVTGAEVELFFPGGLLRYDSNAAAQNFTVQHRVSYREVGTEDWTSLPDISTTAKQLTPFWIAVPIVLPARGWYDIQVERLTPNYDDAVSGTDRITSRSIWSSLRSIRPEYPLNYATPKALIALRIKASGQLNGVLENFSIFARRLCPDWDAATETWIVRATSNPASIARLVLQGPQNAVPVPDSEIDLAAFQEWHEFCADKGLTYNRYVTDPICREDLLAEVCHAGRAFPLWRGGKRTIVIDRPRTQFVDCLSARNSWGLQEADPPSALPDAFVVNFLDATNNYMPARRVVPFPGFVGTPVLVEEIAMPGKTDPAEIWREVRRRQYEAIHRRRRWTVSQDHQHYVTGLGDAAFLSHPVIDRRQAAGLVRAVAGEDVWLDELVTMEDGGTYRCRFRTPAGATMEREVVTVAGTSRTVTLTPGAMPAIGDHATFYALVAPAIEVIAKSIERGDNHSGHLTLIDHAPQIDTLTDAEVPPPWSGRYGAELRVLFLEESGGEALFEEDGTFMYEES